MGKGRICNPFSEITPLIIVQEKLFYVQDCVKKILVTANIYYIDISRKKYSFHNYKYL